jgi:hypothetical protein
MGGTRGRRESSRKVNVTRVREIRNEEGKGGRALRFLPSSLHLERGPMVKMEERNKCACVRAYLCGRCVCACVSLSMSVCVCVSIYVFACIRVCVYMISVLL